MTRGRRLLFWAILVFGTLGAGELIVRLTLRPPGLLRRGDDAMLMMPQEPIGYALRPGAAWHFTAGGHVAPIRINAKGFRDGPFDEAVEANMRILGAGDSFTLGLGVDSTDPWPEQLEQLLQGQIGPSVRVVNTGVPGYSARQMRQTVEAVAPELRPQVVIFAVTGDNYWRVERPYLLLEGYLVKTDALPMVRLGRDGVYFSPIMRWQWLNHLDIWLNQHFQLYGWAVGTPAAGSAAPAAKTVDLAEAERRLAPTLDEMLKADSVTRADGAAFVVLLVNTQQLDGSFDRNQFTYNEVFRRFCEAHHIRVVDPLPTLDQTAAGRPIYRSYDDPHWTRAAHRVVAEVLDRYLLSAGLIPASPSTSSGTLRRP
jgi:hypothetical protein